MSTTLFDADAAATDELAVRRRARTTIADLDADFRAGLIGEYLAARRTGVWFDELRLLAQARKYDEAHPDELSLFDELHAIELFGTQFGEAA